MSIELECLGRSDEAGEPDGSAEVGHEGPVELEQSHPRVVGGEPEVARERELHAGTEGVSLHLGDGRIRRVLEPRERTLDGEDAVDTVEVRFVAAGGGGPGTEW